MAEQSDRIEAVPSNPRDSGSSSGTTATSDSFAEQARSRQGGIVGEYVAYLKHSKKWWMTPIIVLLLVVGGVLVLGGTVAAPLLYTLF